MKASILAKIRSAIGGIILGIVLVLAALVVLWFNEGRAVVDYRSVSELEHFTVSISPHVVNPDNEGSPVYITWRAQTDDVLRDKEFGIEKTALRMVRTVEMRQWIEDRPTESQFEQGVQPVYSQVWARERISSEEFILPEEHENPPMRYISKTWLADEVSLGAFRLPTSMILKLKDYVAVDATNAVPTIPESVIHQQGSLYIGEDPAIPQVGDMRISFRALEPQQVSLIARQFGRTFDSFISREGNVYAPIRPGVHSLDQLIRYEQAAVKSTTIIIRIAGFALAFVGILMVLSPFTLLTAVVPLFQRIARFGLAMISAVLAGILSLLVISLAWIAYRPALAVGLSILVIFLIIFLAASLRKRDEVTEKVKRRMLAEA